MKPIIRQTRGPGMNLGIKKPRKIPATPKDIASAVSTKTVYGKTAAGKATPAEKLSYLPPDSGAQGGKPRMTSKVRASKTSKLF